MQHSDFHACFAQFWACFATFIQACGVKSQIVLLTPSALANYELLFAQDARRNVQFPSWHSWHIWFRWVFSAILDELSDVFSACDVQIPKFFCSHLRRSQAMNPLLFGMSAKTMQFSIEESWHTWFSECVIRYFGCILRTLIMLVMLKSRKFSARAFGARKL